MGVFRLVLAIIVVLTHTSVPLTGHALSGRLPVSAFYVISGFYMQYIITTKYGGTAHWVRNFYISRAIRLFPLYYLALAATVIYELATHRLYPTNTLMYNRFVFDQGGLVVKSLYAVSNLFIVGQDILRLSVLRPMIGQLDLFVNPDQTTYGINGTELNYLGQSWSLAIEIWFYLLAPWLLRRKIAVLVGAIIAATALRVALMSAGHAGDWRQGADWINAFFPVEIGTFCLGACACRFYLAKFSGESPVGPATTMGYALVAVVIVSCFGFGHTVAPLYPWSYIAVVLIVATSLPWIFNATRKSRLDDMLGELSYPVYISHLFVVGVIKGSVGRESLPYVAVIASLILSAILVRLIDRPLNNFRHRHFGGVTTEKRSAS